jgi:aspartate aminotransferase
MQACLRLTANHPNVFRSVGINVATFTYYDRVTQSLDFETVKREIDNLAPRSVILLQTSAHNPTGCDPNIDQWQELAKIFLQKEHFAFLDCSYFGLVNGNTDTVSESGGIRVFEDHGIPLLLAATFSKNFGLYAERVGVVSLIAPADEQLQSRIRKQFTFLARSQTGASPSFGSKVVTMILTNSELRHQWEQDITGMAAETQYRRQLLQAELKKIQAQGDWSFLTEHVGMFS